MPVRSRPAAERISLNSSGPSGTDYRPVWLDGPADDVTIEGSAMNGVAQGAEAVRSNVTYIRTLYDSQEFNFAGLSRLIGESFTGTPHGEHFASSAPSKSDLGAGR